jgi:lauroyl/myristoyl acyltransferase
MWINYSFIQSANMRLILIKSILLSCAWLPLPIIHGLGIVIGWGFMIIPNRVSRDTKTNIALCFPALTQIQQRRLIRKSLIETGKTIIETSALWMLPGEKALRLIRYIDGLDVALRARERVTGDSRHAASGRLGSGRIVLRRHFRYDLSLPATAHDRTGRSGA